MASKMSNPLYSRRFPAGSPPTLRPSRGVCDMPSTSDEVLTTVFISNLHCGSCVNTIERVLRVLKPCPIAVDVSIVTQAVTVRHSRALSPMTIKAALDDAGFDLVTTPTGHEEQHITLTDSLSRINPLVHSKLAKHVEQCAQCQLEAKNEAAEEKLHYGADDVFPVQTLSKLTSDSASTPTLSHKAIYDEKDQGSVTPSSSSHQVSLSIGGMTCASCSTTITECLSALPGVTDVVVNLLGNSATATVDDPDRVTSVVAAIEDAGYEAEVVSMVSMTKPLPRNIVPEGPYNLTLFVGGMTCASCVVTITGLMESVSGTSEVAVNLLGKSATAVITRRELAEQLVTAIEDAGYEAEVTTVEPLVSERSDGPIGPRTVDIRVEGLFCQHCPEKVMALLQPIESRITIIKPITSYKDPIFSVSYTPSPPDFTMRNIVDAISHPDSPLSRPFTATVHHPPTLEERARYIHRHEQLILLQRLIFSVIVAIPTFIIGVVYMSLVPHSNRTRMWWMKPMWAGNVARMQWALFFLATPVMFYSAGLYHKRSLKELHALWKKGSRVPIWKRFVRFGSMNLLVSSGVSVAYFSSIALLALAASQQASSTGEGDSTTYFDSVVLLTMFLLCGRFLEAYSKGRTADAITALGKLRPTTALLVNPQPSLSAMFKTLSPNLTLSASRDPEKDAASTSSDLSNSGPSLSRISAELLEVGDVVRVQVGASPPADGTLVSIMGEHASFDESSLTGESRLVKKCIGEMVFVGTINRGAIVDVRVDAIGGETMLDHIVKVVREGQTRRAPIERVADLLTGYFVPVVTLLAITTWVIWLGLGLSGSLPQDYLDISVGGWTVWSLEFAIAVFVVACPCGIGLAAPTALLVGSGLAAKFGILVRGGGEAFQEAAQTDLIVFDKTGTLTEGGDPCVTDMQLLPSSLQPGVALGVAAELESSSTHPLASAIRTYCEKNGATRQNASSVQETAGRGLSARFETLQLEAIIGNEAWMLEHGMVADMKIDALLSSWKSEGKSVALLAIRPLNAGGAFEPLATFAIADPLRNEAGSVISLLQKQGISTWMVSGDNVVTAHAVARTVGIPETNVIAGVLPHEKAQKIQWLQQVGQKRAQRGWRRWIGLQRLNERCVVAMVGDGINDAPALSAADVSVAIGSGSDVAISSASFILVSSNLSGILTLFDLSRTVFNRVKFNFLWATVYNLIALPVAAGVIYPAGHARLAPVWASLAMALSSVSVVCSSLLLKLYKERSVSSS